MLLFKYTLITNQLGLDKICFDLLSFLELIEKRTNALKHKFIVQIVYETEDYRLVKSFKVFKSNLHKFRFT